MDIHENTQPRIPKSIYFFDELLVEIIEELAKENHRSFSAQVIFLIEQALKEESNYAK